MDDILPKHFAGPGKLRIFTILIMVIVYALVIGSLLSLFYDIHIVEDIAMAAANHPIVVLDLAGLIAISLLVVKGIAYANEIGLLSRY